MARPKDVAPRKWYLMDAADVVLGRLATEAVRHLRGKHKPIYTPYIDSGDFIIIVNAERIRLTGKKRTNKIYYRHSRYPGGLHSITAQELLSGKSPERVVEYAIRGMLPKNKLGRQMFRKLKVYTGAQHPHEAQKPIALEIES